MTKENGFEYRLVYNTVWREVRKETWIGSQFFTDSIIKIDVDNEDNLPLQSIYD